VTSLARQQSPWTRASYRRPRSIRSSTTLIIISISISLSRFHHPLAPCPYPRRRPRRAQKHPSLLPLIGPPPRRQRQSAGSHLTPTPGLLPGLCFFPTMAHQVLFWKWRPPGRRTPLQLRCRPPYPQLSPPNSFLEPSPQQPRGQLGPLPPPIQLVPLRKKRLRFHRRLLPLLGPPPVLLSPLGPQLELPSRPGPQGRPPPQLELPSRPGPPGRQPPGSSREQWAQVPLPPDRGYRRWGSYHSFRRDRSCCRLHSWISARNYCRGRDLGGRSHRHRGYVPERCRGRGCRLRWHYWRSLNRSRRCRSRFYRRSGCGTNERTNERCPSP
jgi:hypothetical protein